MQSLKSSSGDDCFTLKCLKWNTGHLCRQLPSTSATKYGNYRWKMIPPPHSSNFETCNPEKPAHLGEKHPVAAHYSLPPHRSFHINEYVEREQSQQTAGFLV